METLNAKIFYLRHFVKLNPYYTNKKQKEILEKLFSLLFDVYICFTRIQKKRKTKTDIGIQTI